MKKEYKDRMNGEEPAFGVVTTSVNLLDPDADTGPLIEAIRAEKKRMGVTTAMLVIDTLSRAMAGGNENAPDDMGALVANSDRIRLEALTHTMWVHHSGKDQARGARGHSLLRAATDTEIEVSSSDGVSIAAVKKQREFEGGEQYAFALKRVTVGVNDRGKEITSCIVQQTEMPEKAKRPEPTGDNQKIVLAAIREGVKRDGALRLPDGFPNINYLPYEQLKRDVEGIMKGEKRRVTQAFETAYTSLLARGYIASKGNMIWLTE
jgi:RecA-family ATPase